MPQDDKHEKPQSEKNEIEDNSDAFARAKPAGDPGQSPNDRTKSNKKKKGAAPREPVIDPKKEIVIDEDELPPMTAQDAADVIISMMDQLFEMAIMFRGYDNVAVRTPDGNTIRLLDKMREHDKLKKDMLRRDLARVLKSSGGTISPNVALGMSGLICYALPVVALEFSIYQGKKAQGEK